MIHILYMFSYPVRTTKYISIHHLRRKRNVYRIIISKIKTKIVVLNKKDRKRNKLFGIKL